MRLATGLLMGLPAIVLCGCGSDRVPTYPVAGRVEFADGEPVRVGTIELESRDFGTAATGTIQDDGSFVLGTYTATDGAAVGSHRAIVVQIVIDDGSVTHATDHGRPVPQKFGSYDTSDLLVEIEPIDENDLTITLPVDE